MSSKAESLKKAGNDAFRVGKHEEAITLYTEAFTLDPSQYTYPLNRCMCYLKLGKNREAERDATKSLQLLPTGNPKALYRRGLARKNLGKLELARADFEEALQEDPSNAAVKTELESLPPPPQTTDVKVSKPVATDNPEKPVTAEHHTKPPLDPGPSAAPSETRSKLDAASKRSLKAAITPESSADGGSEMMSAVSTRRLTKPTPPSGPSAATENKKDLDSTGTVRDFKALRIARDQRIQSTSPRIRQAQGSTELSSESLAQDPGGSSSAKPGVEPIHTDKLSPPKSMYELEKRWQDHRDVDSRMAILLSLVESKADIPALVGSSLSPELLDDVLLCLKETCKQEQALVRPAATLLVAFSRCQRFHFVSTLCANVHYIQQILENTPERTAIESAWGLT